MSYVREGSTIYEDSTGASKVVRAGEFHRITLGDGFNHQERNESATHWAQIVQIWLRTTKNCVPGFESKLFGIAERRQGLCLVASPDGADGSLTVHHDCRLYSTLMPAGRHLAHALAPRRTACLQVLEGEVQLNELVLQAGDIGILKDEPTVSFLSKSDADVLLIDAGQGTARSNGGIG